ncbi:MAG: hypothetical protein ABIJ48_11685 [Actinomycetota bacterium]
MRRLTVGLIMVLVATGCGDDAALRTTVTTVSEAPTPTSQAPTTTSSTTTTEATTTQPTTTTSAAATTTTAPPPSGCSTSGIVGVLPDEPDLPGAVDDMRWAIMSAAMECDINTLAALGLPGEFAWSYDPNAADDPADHWRFMEDFGSMPLAGMVELLSLPYGVTEQVLVGVPLYVWPSVAVYDDWASAPEADRQAIVDLYGESVLDEVEDLWEDGYYLGSHLAIDHNGDWQWYITPGN